MGPVELATLPQQLRPCRLLTSTLGSKVWHQQALQRMQLAGKCTAAVRSLLRIYPSAPKLRLVNSRLLSVL